MPGRARPSPAQGDAAVPRQEWKERTYRRLRDGAGSHAALATSSGRESTLMERGDAQPVGKGTLPRTAQACPCALPALHGPQGGDSTPALWKRGWHCSPSPRGRKGPAPAMSPMLTSPAQRCRGRPSTGEELGSISSSDAPAEVGHLTPTAEPWVTCRRLEGSMVTGAQLTT